MMINQIVEETRGGGRHGSCGKGIGETVERNLHSGYQLRLSDLYNRDATIIILKHIRDQWVTERLQNLGVREINASWKRRIRADGILEWYMQEIRKFLDKIQPTTIDILNTAEHIIFEGAQGLLLDQDHGFFPHVTRSHTGLKNVIALAHEAGIDELKVWYLTRSYLTRHGAGPMPHEMPEPVYSKIHDPTNIPNPYQGSLRFGLLNTDLLRETIWRDMRYVPARMKFSYGLSVSCMDQIDDKALYVARSETQRSSPDAFLDFLQRETEVSSMIASYGPSRDDVRILPLNDRSTALAG